MVLEVVVAASSPIVVAVHDQVVDKPLALGVREHLAGREEPVLQISDGPLASLEAREVILAQEHHFDDDDDLLCVLLQCEEALLHQFAVLAEVLGPVAAENLDLLGCELERGLLELDALARRVRQEEAEVDVHDVAFNVDHDVPIVPVLDLQDVAQKRVGRQRLAKILPSQFVGPAPRGAKLVSEVVDDADVFASQLFLDARDAERIVADLDQAAPLPCRQNLVRLQPQIKLLLLEDLVELIDQLDRELLLSHIIIGLDDDSEQLPRQQASVRRVASYPLLLLLRCLWEDVLPILFVDPVLHLTRQILGLHKLVLLFLGRADLPSIGLLSLEIGGSVVNQVIDVAVVLQEHALRTLLDVGIQLLVVGVLVVAVLQQVFVQHVLQSVLGHSAGVVVCFSL